MKIIVVCLSCLCLLNHAFSQSSDEIQAIIGDTNLTIEGEINHDFPVDKFEIYHRNLVTGAERHLAGIDDYGFPNASTSQASGYNISVTNINATLKTVSLVIASVQFHDDGLFHFYAENTGNSSHNASADQGLTVLKPATDLMLTVMPLNSVDTTSSRVYEVDAVNDTLVVCVVKGSNPATSNFTLTFNGNVVDNVTLDEGELMSTTERIYNRSAYTHIDIREMDGRDQNFECTVTDPTGNTLSTGVNFKVDVSGSEYRGPFMNLIISLAMTVLWYQML